MSRASSAIVVDGVATGTSCRMTSLTVGSAPGAMLASHLLERAELGGDRLGQIARDHSQGSVLTRCPLRRTATDIDGQGRCIRAIESLGQKRANRSAKNVAAARGGKRSRGVRGS